MKFRLFIFSTKKENMSWICLKYISHSFDTVLLD